MTALMKGRELVFTPLLLNDVIITFKDKAIDIKDRLLISSFSKIFEIMYNESLEMKNNYLKARTEFSVMDMKQIDLDKLYDYLEIPEEKLWIIHSKLKDSTNIYEMQLFDIIDKTLDNYASINNILGYFESKIIQDGLESA